MIPIEKQLHELMRNINKSCRSVSWGRSNYLYGHPYQTDFPRTEWNAVVFYPESCRIEQSFASLNCESLYRDIKEWAIEKGIIAKEEPVVELAACGGNPF